MKEDYEVLSLCKADFEEFKFSKKDVEELDEADMRRIARKVGDILCDSVYWPTLKDVVEIVIAEKKKRLIV